KGSVDMQAARHTTRPAQALLLARLSPTRIGRLSPETKFLIANQPKIRTQSNYFKTMTAPISNRGKGEGALQPDTRQRQADRMVAASLYSPMRDNRDLGSGSV
ncbi:MAG: hypothetical protein WA875_13860, partial [Candidatus Acidiferrales bacterium]